MKFSLVALVGIAALLATVQASEFRQAKGFRMEKAENKNFGGGNEISQFLNTKNIVKTIVKLVFGTAEESTATSRQVLNLLVKVLDMLKTNFHQRNARSAGSRGLKETMDDAATAGISMLKGFARSAMHSDTKCVQRNVCEAASTAVRESRELGSMIAQFAGYASTYLDGTNTTTKDTNYEAARVGRSGGDCRKMFPCNEA